MSEFPEAPAEATRGAAEARGRRGGGTPGAAATATAAGAGREERATDVRGRRGYRDPISKQIT